MELSVRMCSSSKAAAQGQMHGKTEVSFGNGGRGMGENGGSDIAGSLIAPVLILKVKNYHSCRRSNAGLSSALSFTGEVTPGEERNHQKWFSWRNHVFLADGLASQQGLQSSQGTFSLWLARR